MVLGVKEVGHVQHGHLRIEVADGSRGNQRQIQIADLKGLHHLPLLPQRAVRVYLHLKGAAGLLVYQFGEFVHAKVKVAAIRQHMAALKHDCAGGSGIPIAAGSGGIALLSAAGGEGECQQSCQHQGDKSFFHGNRPFFSVHTIFNVVFYAFSRIMGWARAGSASG